MNSTELRAMMSAKILAGIMANPGVDVFDVFRNEPIKYINGTKGPVSITQQDLYAKLAIDLANTLSNELHL